MSDRIHWDDRYRTGDIPWDTGRPSSELVRVVGEEDIRRGPAVELGCGTGANVVWLAGQGFAVSGVDISPLAVARARQRAAGAGVVVRLVEADVLDPQVQIGGGYEFFFDRGCYHVVRRMSAERYVDLLQSITTPGAVGLVLTGNAHEPHKPGPPVVTEEEIRAELGRHFTIVRLREFRFDPVAGTAFEPLGWSCLLRK
jgi:SAM-dependent methyltransferase